MVETSREGGSALLSTHITGIESWPSGYTLAIAGFADGNEYALVSKNITAGMVDGKCEITLSGIPNEVSTIEVCAIDRLRRRVACFVSADYTGASGITEITISDIDMSMAGAIQKDIFNTTCVQCHGGSNFAAAGLNLTEGHSWDNMIGVISIKDSDRYRVKPGDSANSILYMILSGDYSTNWHYDHSVEVVKQEKLDLIRDWIDNGANH